MEIRYETVSASSSGMVLPSHRRDLRCSHFKIPPIVGIRIVGVACWPYGLGWGPHNDQVDILSDVGVVMLIFAIGKLSVSELVRLRKPVFVGGSL